ncbi:MAG: type I methionyl aminopeptidase [Saprospiraceae bacterium]|nr:type I methionyl aminopeptidase [Saprospiraceae bacterium]
MIYLKHDEEIELIRVSSLLVCKTLAQIAKVLKIGKTGLEIDKLAEEFIRDHGAIPAFKGYQGFPGTLCISANECVVHGIPSNKPFESGDILSIDCGVVKDGFYGDSAYSFLLGEVSEDVIKLARVTEAALYLGIEQAIVGQRIGDIGQAIQEHAEKRHHYGVVRELVGHGIGKKLHEAPEVPNYGQKGKGPVLKEGLTIAIEPMINQGTRHIKQLKDGWTVVSTDLKASAHYEHTIAVRNNGPEILSDHQMIKDEIKNNSEIIL